MVSSGGTAQSLRSLGIPATDVAELTGFPSMLGGRVKTLHPAVHAGILAKAQDTDELHTHGFKPFDLVCVNLYPFQEWLNSGNKSMKEGVEVIDIGGSSLLRGAAKNCERVTILSSPAQYDALAEELQRYKGATSHSFRQLCAARAFRHSADYDEAIAGWFQQSSAPSQKQEGEEQEVMPSKVQLPLTRVAKLRYGENPHQAAALYSANSSHQPLSKIQGQRELSFNNLVDASRAIASLRFLPMPACAVIKHASPCGAAQSDNLVSAWEKAVATDKESAFGGIVAFNREVDDGVAQALLDFGFLEVVIAPAFSEQALSIFAKRKNLRCLLSPETSDAQGLQWSHLGGPHFLAQQG